MGLSLYRLRKDQQLTKNNIPFLNGCIYWIINSYAFEVRSLPTCVRPPPTTRWFAPKLANQLKAAPFHEFYRSDKYIFIQNLYSAIKTSNFRTLLKEEDRLFLPFRRNKCAIVYKKRTNKGYRVWQTIHNVILNPNYFGVGHAASTVQREALKRLLHNNICSWLR